MNEQNESQQNEPNPNLNPEPVAANQSQCPEPIQNSTTNPPEVQNERKEPEPCYFTGEHDAVISELDELTERMVTVYTENGSDMRLRFDKDLLPSTMAPIVAAMRNVSSHSVMSVHEALTDKNTFLRKDGGHWPVRGFIMAVTDGRLCGYPEGPELWFKDWKFASFAWDNGTVTIDVDGNVGKLINCGAFAKLMLTRLAPDMDDDHKTVGLYGYEKFVFGFRADEDGKRAQMRVRLDQTEIDWNISDEKWSLTE